MKPEKFTTEGTEKKNFRFFKNSVNSVIASSQKEYTERMLRVHREGERSDLLATFLYLNLFSVFSVVNF